MKVNAPATGTPANTDTVTFFDGTTVLGTATLTGGVASYMTSAFAAGTHSITAQYGGDTMPGLRRQHLSGYLRDRAVDVHDDRGDGEQHDPSRGRERYPDRDDYPGDDRAFGSDHRHRAVLRQRGAVNPTAVVVNGTTATYATTALAPGSHSITATYSSSTSP